MNLSPGVSDQPGQHSKIHLKKKTKKKKGELSLCREVSVFASAHAPYYDVCSASPEAYSSETKQPWTEPKPKP